MSSFQEITTKIKELIKTGKIRYASRHIETDRKYREINLQDVKAVLNSGKVSSIGIDGRIEWTGRDLDQREIKLLCRMSDKDRNDTLDVLEAVDAVVGTAYQPRVNDEELKNAWLEKNKDWRVNPQGYVEKKNGKKS